MEAELAINEGAIQSRDELAAKDATEHFDRKKESIAWVDPARMVEGKPAGRNDAMDMRMMLQLLIPGMEHAAEADVGTEMPGIASVYDLLLQASAATLLEVDLLVAQGQRSQQMRDLVSERAWDGSGEIESSIKGLQSLRRKSPTIT